MIEEVEEDKMSDSSYREWSDEERIVAAVGGRARRLVEAVRRIGRGRAGRTLPNIEEAPNGQTQTDRREVGTPCGRAEAQERLIPGLGGLQPWGGRDRGLSLVQYT